MQAGPGASSGAISATAQPSRVWSTPIFLVGLLLLALLVRLSLLNRAGWLLDGDDALSSLMAFEILAGDRPLMLRNQTYAGAWQPYAMAASYRVFGVSRQSAHLPELLASLALVPAAWLLAREAAGPVAGRFAAALAALAPAYQLVLSLKPWAPYTEVVLLGTLMLWATLRLAWPGVGQRDALWALGCGLAGGLALWLHPLAVEYLLPAALLLILRLRGRRLLLVPLLGLVGFGFGSLPLWLYNFESGGATLWFILAGSGGQTADRLTVLQGWFRTDLPRGAGLWQPSGPSSPELGTCLAILIIVAVLAALLTPRPPGARLARLDGPLLVLGTIPLIAVFSGFGSLVVNPWGFDATGRYTQPIWGTLVVLIGALLGNLARWRRLAALALAGTVLAINLLGSLTVDAVDSFQSPYWRRLPVDNRPLLDLLSSQGIEHVWLNHWAAFPLMFDARAAGQPLIAADWYDVQAGGIDRFPEHRALVEQSADAAFVLVTDEPEPALSQRLRLLRVRFDDLRASPYLVIIPRSRPVLPAEVTADLDYRY
jgi:Dolichyl-phosphate-mannose-protein mannosyltransferase